MRRNLVPVWVWKQVSRKKDVSRVSMPVAGRWGFGFVKVAVVVEEEEGGLFSRDVVAALGLLFGRLVEAVVILGVRDFVMACTPWKVPAKTR